jgi:hypothetical protein
MTFDTAYTAAIGAPVSQVTVKSRKIVVESPRGLETSPNQSVTRYGRPALMDRSKALIGSG